MSVDSYVAALLEERAGYEARGDAEGVRAVDAELVACGHVPAKRESAAVDGAVEFAVVKAPRRRRSADG